jgi:hypothetical protein
MKKLKKFDELNEADIHDVLPEDYLRNVERKGRQQYGNGPSRQEMMEAMRLMEEIARIQHGHEEELTQIGIDILLKNYPILSSVKLDAKIVDPDDEEKMDMTMKALNEDEPEEDESEDIEDVDDVDPDEVGKRKIANNLMQGESQNVHSMMYQSRDEVDKINPRLLDMYMRHLEINKKFDWWDQASLKQSMSEMPQFSNMMETDYEDEENEEEKETKPTIKARVLDLPMMLHEVVKGIYELIAANAIPEDSVKARKVLAKTDTLDDERLDVRYGPFIAADMRNYLNTNFDKEIEKYQSDNIKELIYGKMMLLPTKQFIDVVKGMLMEEKGETLSTLKKIVKECIDELEKYEKGDSNINYKDVEDYDIDNKTEYDFTKKKSEEDDYSKLNQRQLHKLLDKALDDGDTETINKLQQYLKENKNPFK